MTDRFEQLLAAARTAQQNAYAPFSNFRVGAALETEQGSVFAGCNVENASFGVTMCAERVAVGAAVAAGERRYRRIVVVTDSPTPASPCGACRQVLAEFAPDMDVVSVAPDGTRKQWKAADLLPDRFILRPEERAR